MFSDSKRAEEDILTQAHDTQAIRIQDLFEERAMPLEYHALELALSQYVVIIAPLMRSLWSLEASTANASDVFVFFTAIAAQLRDLFEKSPRETGIPTELANSIIDLFNDEYDNLFLNNDIYFAAFALDPRKLKLSLIIRVCSSGG